MTQPGQPAASPAPAGYPAPADYYGEIESGAAAIAALVAGGAVAMPIPACPGWTLRELAIHVGRAHRWAAQIVATRSAAFIEFRSVPDGRFPDEPGAQAGWLAAGAQRAVAAFAEAGQEPVWALGPLAPASFWARRMGHETLVHAADARLAAGQQPDLPPALAADAIDEWLTVLMPLHARPADPREQARPADPREQALPRGAALHVRPAGADGWVIRREPAGVTVTRTARREADGRGAAGRGAEGREAGGREAGGPGAEGRRAGEAGGPAEGDAVLAGPAGAVLLALMGRVPPGDPAVTVSGDRALLDRWLAAAQF